MFPWDAVLGRIGLGPALPAIVSRSATLLQRAVLDDCRSPWYVLLGPSASAFLGLSALGNSGLSAAPALGLSAVELQD